MKRRNFIKFCSKTSALSLLDPLQFQQLYAATSSPKRMLILIELKGGNDGLNTLIPYADNEYFKLRPTLSIKKDKVLKIDKDKGLHPSLTFLHQQSQKKNVAILEGIGYPNPNLSHFRSTDIWETASDSHHFLAEGWLNHLLPKIGDGSELIKGIVFGENSLGPFRGATKDVLVMNNPKQFLRKKTKLETYSISNDINKESLNHILSVENSISHTIEEIRKKTLIEPSKESRLNNFPKHKMTGSLNALMKILASGHYVPIYKISIGGFDTHTQQENNHQRLLKVLDNTYKSLYEGLTQLGLWQKSLIFSYSEFGRRPKENGSKGTDHGTASVHFAMGGEVKGGFYGKAPSLVNLDQEFNLIYNLDFRSVYATIIKDWFKIKNSSFANKWIKQSPKFISSFG